MKYLVPAFMLLGALGVAGCEGETVTRRDFESLGQKVGILEGKVRRLEQAELKRKEAEEYVAKKVQESLAALPPEPRVSGQPSEVPQPTAGSPPPDIDSILREVRDEMFTKFLTEGVPRRYTTDVGQSSLMPYVSTAPRYLEVEEGRKGGPLEFMFRAFPGTFGQDLSQITSDLIEAYKSRVQERCRESGVKIEKIPVGKLTNDGLKLAFYDVVRDPSDEHLRQIYRFVSTPTIPRFLKGIMTSQQVIDALARAKELVGAQERGTLKFFHITYDQPDPTDPNDKRNPEDVREVWEPVMGLGRAYNGELVGAGEYSGVRFGKQEEKTLSSFTRWLFRRGPDFIDSLRGMVTAYKGSKTEDEFVAGYHKQTGTAH